MPKSSWNFLHAFYLFERPGAVADPLRGVREALAPEKLASYPAQLSVHLNSSHELMEDRMLPPARHIDGGKDSGRTKRLFRIATSNNAPIAINKGAALHIGC